MDKFTYLNNSNGAFVEDLYQKYQLNPDSVDEGWKKFFEGYEFASQDSDIAPTKSYEGSLDSKEINVLKLINAYRTRGHLKSHTNPIRERRQHRTDLDLEYFSLTEADLDSEFEVAKELSIPKTSLRNIVEHLERTYCHALGVEFRHIRNPEQRQWLYGKMEPSANDPHYTKEQRKHILKKINQAVTFEHFLHTKYVGQKRFSLEGCEALIPAMDSLIETGAELGAKEFVIGMAHRGRLNMLVNIFGKSYESVFSEFEGSTLPDDVEGDGDVKYHLGKSADVVTDKGHKVHLSLTANPSHLEAVNPVVTGIVRAKGDKLYNNKRDEIVPVVIHGDAAIAGQGIVYECSNFMNLDGYSTGGTVHIVLNNQIGFTANYRESRSSIYCTDVAKVTESPVFHVNADKPEAVAHAVELAIQFRQKFGVDVYVDILGYRKYGHNEGDEPKFTQPILYNSIKKHKNVHDIYVENLVKRGVLTEEEAKQNHIELKQMLQEKLDEARLNKRKVEVEFLGRNWKGLRVASSDDFNRSIETGFKDLEPIARALTEVPSGFNLFSKMNRLLTQRRNMFFEKHSVDWGLAELLAFGSLLTEGHGVRISGQDSQRGTFSHRHSVIRDEKTENEYIPLNHISEHQAKYQAFNSHLSEYGVLGFEYGYSLAMPNNLTIWEAQFGDFSNGAQIMIDQFISASESKWQRMSGLVMMLPHGYEGQGPEHSSARIERYLQLCGQNNMIVCQPTTPANLFHLLRRQIHQEFRKPLVIFTPKSLLRHPEVISSVDELKSGNYQEIIDLNGKNVKKVKRVILCSGKIYYELLEHKQKEKRTDVALIRIEQLYPFAQEAIQNIFEKYEHVGDWIWAQEEPENMGAWWHIRCRMPLLNLRCVARKESASVATGSGLMHTKQQQELIIKAFA